MKITKKERRALRLYRAAADGARDHTNTRIHANTRDSLMRKGLVCPNPEWQRSQRGPVLLITDAGRRTLAEDIPNIFDDLFLVASEPL